MWNIIFLLLLNFSIGRIIEKSIPFRQFSQKQGWIYLDKMTFAPGACRVNIQTSTIGNPLGQGSQVFIVAVPEQRWQQENKLRCQASMKMPLAFHHLLVNGTPTSSNLAFGVDQYKTFYFLIKDCQKRLLPEYENPNLTISVKMHLLNNDKQIGQQQDHWYIFPFLIISGMIIVSYYMKQYKSINEEQVNWPKLLLFLGTVTQISSLFWKAIGYGWYSYSGTDHFLFHLIYLLLHSASESSVLSLLCLVSFGWTLIFNNGNQFKAFVPLVGCLGVINIVLTLGTKISNLHDMHHMFDNTGGKILVFYRIFLALVFFVGLFFTFRKTKHQLKKFLYKFSIFGFIYILSLPVVVIFANYYVQTRNRHEFVFITIQIIKFITNTILMYQGNSQQSEYSKINFTNTSFLPEEQRGFK